MNGWLSHIPLSFLDSDTQQPILSLLKNSWHPHDPDKSFMLSHTCLNRIQTWLSESEWTANSVVFSSHGYLAHDLPCAGDFNLNPVGPNSRSCSLPSSLNSFDQLHHSQLALVSTDPAGDSSSPGTILSSATHEVPDGSANNSTDRVAQQSPAPSTHAVVREVDTSLTELKLSQLRRDIQQLEAAVRSNEASQKDLDDWLFDQMSALAISAVGASAVAVANSETGIKRIFEERSKLLRQQLKALNDQRDATRYIVKHLEQHGIPTGAIPKEYVRDLLRQRGKIPSPAKVSDDSPKSAAQRLEELPSARPVGPLRPAANTLPSFSNSSHVPSVSEARRLVKTLPPSTQISERNEPALPRNLSFLNSKLNQTSSAEVREKLTEPHFVQLPDPRNFSDPLFSLLPNTTQSPPRPSVASHPTSPELFSISYTENAHDPRTKPPRVSLPPNTHGRTHHLLNSMRHGLE